MNSRGDRRDEEIAVSVAAHRDLGSEYDDAIAAGLVERIGAEVDRRVDERISQYQRGGRPAAGHAGNSAPALASKRCTCQPSTPAVRSPGSRSAWPSAPWWSARLRRRASTPTTEMEPGRSSSCGSPSCSSMKPSSASAAPLDATAAPRIDRPAGCHSVVLLIPPGLADRFALARGPQGCTAHPCTQNVPSLAARGGTPMPFGRLRARLEDARHPAATER